ncbi:DgyrCDS1449 [Dimorphilus gyrociliatus]|uniref:DgyrCDS1449 n=1 Tax=Dimorphilus gyrociliatus TaxID=2664684 RepID=A0A7I8V966_9ANNE|nr:DgyrCDS1449 [Dimorphilus gyrociliatus]
MAFFQQLRLLLWKNFTLKRRKPIMTTVEIIWPLFLFIILAWVRTRGLKEFNHECHFDAKALPSTGIFPFLQSVVCSLNNTCHINETDTERRLLTDTFSSSSLTTIISDFDVVLSNENNIEALARLIVDADNLRKLVSDDILSGNVPCTTQLTNLLNSSDFRERLKEDNISLSNEAITLLLQSDINETNALMRGLDFLRDQQFNPNRLNEEAETIFCDKNEFDRLLTVHHSDNETEILRQSICGLPGDQRVDLLNDLIQAISIPRLIEGLNNCSEAAGIPRVQSRFEEINSLTRIANDISQLNSLWKAFGDIQQAVGTSDAPTSSRISKLLCGRSSQFLERILRSQESANEALPTTKRPSNDDNDHEAHENDQRRKCVEKYENMTDYCKSFICSMQESRSTRLLWRQLGPIVRGNILYTPDIPVVREFLNNSLTLFQQIGLLKQFAKDFLDITPDLVSTVNSEWFEVILSAVQSPQTGSIFPNTTGVNDFQNLIRNQNLSDLIETVAAVINATAQFLDCVKLDKLQGIESEGRLLYEGQKMISNGTFWAGIVFEIPEDAKEIPDLLHYKIRMDSAKIDNTKYKVDRFWRPGPRRMPFSDLKYFLSGFIFLQDMIDSYYIKTRATDPNEANLGMYMQQFPYPCYIYDQFVRALTGMMPLFMTVAWILSVAMIVRSIVYEKEKRLKEVMRTMGLGNLVHWIASFITSLIILLVSCIALLIILKVGKVAEHANAGVILVFLLCHVVATIAQTFLISTLFSRANLAAVCAAIIYFVGYLPYSICLRYEENMMFWHKCVACLSSTVSFGFGCSYIARYEEIGEGLQWSNVGKSPLPDDNFSAATSMLMMLVDSCIYFLITWYIEAVFPGDYGVPQKWYFPVQSSYWRGFISMKKVSDSSTAYHSESLDSTKYEEWASHEKIGVSIKGLTKKFGNKTAVDSLNLNFAHDQITSFLGHNGAGKTTTISILTGIIPPSSGTAVIYDKDIRTDLPEIRKSLGLCPQHNVLFGNLTCEEHVWFYGSLKGMTNAEIKQDLDKLLSDVDLIHKKDALSTSLSGGMQRKLSIAIAFVGNSKVVILDEPTAGVDPHARRAIWELLLKYKKSRTIILCTHFMDEADVLGDKIAIIAHGKLKCYGSSMFLKNSLGDGYQLTLVRAEEQIKDSTAVTRLVCQHVEEARLIEDIGTEMTFQLPSSKSQNFPELFNALEKLKEELGISSYGISDAALEEVFLKVAEDAKVTEGTEQRERDEIDDTRSENNISFPTTFSSFRKRLNYLNKKLRKTVDSRHLVNDHHKNINIENCNGAGSHKIDGFHLLRRQFSGIFIKRFHNTRRNIKGLFAEIVLPAVFVCLAMIFSTLKITQPDQAPLELHPWTLKPSNAEDKHLYMFYSKDSTNSILGDKLEYELTQSETSLGTRCLPSDFWNIDGKSCEKSSSTKWSEPPAFVANYSSLPKCSCENGFIKCPDGAAGPTPAKRILPTTDVIFNLTNYNVSDWLKKTMPDYIKKRYGGYSFIDNNELDLNNSEIVNSTQNLQLLSTLICGNITNCSARAILNDLINISKIAVTPKTAKVWFNNKGHPASVAYLNAFSNMLLRATVNSTTSRRHGIVAVQHPLNLTSLQLEDFALRASAVDVLIAISVIFALSFIPASFVLFLIDERVSNAKHLQLVSGVSPVVYWLSTFAWDMLSYCFSVLICFIIFLCFQTKAYVSADNAPCLLLLLLLYGWSIIPMMYPTNYLFRIPSLAFILLSSINVMVGFLSTISTYFMEFFDDEELQNINNILRKVFLILPHYCLGRGLVDMAANQLSADVFQSLGEVEFKDPLSWEMCGKNLLSMFLLGWLFLALTLCIQYGFWYRKWFPMAKKQYIPPANAAEDPDVEAERHRVQSSDDLLKVDGLAKVYNNFQPFMCRFKPNSAVKGIHFGVRKGQCFGLLGVNGAGKTTTFKMLTGDLDVGHGDAFIDGKSVKKEPSEAFKRLGYCPQFDAIWPLLTAREHLIFFAKIRGVPEKDIARVAQWAISRMSLTRYADRPSGTYSGGNKRKLSTAIALVGNPSIVFLDEPTTGMDPAAKRFLWSAISDIVKEGRSVVLTSHSMEECEALCGRISIMVNGRFKCIGSIQHIKHRFGNGYTLSIRVKEKNLVENAKNFVEKTFTENKKLEEHNTMIKYQIFNCSLSSMFSSIEENKATLGIEDYSLCQTTLDQVFIDFARDQNDFNDDNDDRRQVNSINQYSSGAVEMRSVNGHSPEDGQEDRPKSAVSQRDVVLPVTMNGIESDTHSIA